MKKYDTLLKKLNDNYTKSLKQLATKFRKEVIKPKCRKYNLIFVNGSFYAAPDYKEVGPVECISYGLLPIRKLLMRGIGTGNEIHQLTFFVTDYNPKKAKLSNTYTPIRYPGLLLGKGKSSWPK